MKWFGCGLGVGSGRSSVLVGWTARRVCRYVEAAIAVGVCREGGVEQLTDVVLGQIVVGARPVRPDGHGEGWAALVGRREKIVGWLDGGVPVVKIGELLGREGVQVAQRTLHRFVADELGRGRGQGVTVRVADGEPGVELQIDFAKMGLLPDPVSGRARVCHALIFTAVFSRHMFVWLTHTQTTVDVIAGCEAAWGFFGGVYRVLVPDNLTPATNRRSADRQSTGACRCPGWPGTSAPPRSTV